MTKANIFSKAKRLFSMALVAAMAVTACVSLIPAKSAYAADDGVMREGLTAMQVSQEMGLGINLGNTMEAYEATNCESESYTWIPTIGDNTPSDYECYWSGNEPLTTQAIIDGMKEAGFDTVRIPVFWGNMMENDGTFTINEQYIARVKEIVDYCRNADMYAVINCHHFDEFIIRRYTLDECEEIFTTIWTQIANYFKDYSDYLVFEGFNEYLGGNKFDSNGKLTELPKDEAYEWTNTLNQAFVDAVRSTGGNNSERVLIVSGYWTNIDKTTDSRFIMPTDTAENKLMVSVHYVDNQIYWEYNIGGDRWKEYSINQCELLKEAFYDKGIPVFIGETTSSYPKSNFNRKAEISTSSEALDYMLRLITSYGFTPVLWDTPNNFYSRTSCKIANESDAAVISELSAELKSDTSIEIPVTLNVNDDYDNYDDTIIVTVKSDTAQRERYLDYDGESIVLEKILDGDYTLTFNNTSGFAARSYDVTIEDGKLTEDLSVTLNLLGDINGDAKISIADLSLMYKHINETKLLDGYALTSADVYEDDNDRIDIKDYSTLYKVINGTGSIAVG